MKPLITVITPTYNRSKELPRLFESLQNQKLYNFIWLIVDDGSTDNTKEVIDNFCNSYFRIIYYIKENGGKHTALNLAFKYIKTDLSFIVDSDDYLLPEATLVIQSDWEKYKNKDLCGISYLRGYSANKVIGDTSPSDYMVDNFINMRFNKHIGGDKAEVWVTKYLVEHSYPEFNGEKFFGESYLWIKMAQKRNMLFRNKIIYITEYLEGGLSKSGRALRIKCPQGGMTSAEMMMTPDFSLNQRIKGGILYSCYFFFSNSKCVLLRGKHVILKMICLLPGFLLYLKWRKFK